MNNLLLVLIIGILSGCLLGTIGSPGVGILIPLFVSLNIANFTTALGTYFLAFIYPVCILPFITSYKRKQVKIKEGLVLGAAIFVFSFLASYLAKYINLNTKFIVSGIIFICIGVWYLWYDVKKIRPVPQTSVS